MYELTEQQVHCPYCGETIDVLLDGSDGNQRYTEDCQVCCCPIVFDLAIDNNGAVSARTSREDE